MIPAAAPRRACRRLTAGLFAPISMAASLAVSLAVSLPAPLPAQPPAPPPKGADAITLEQALALALERSPLLRESAARVALAEGALLGARTYPFNPVLETERASRDDGAARTSDREIALSQEIEIAGQRGKRVAAANAAAEAARAAFTRSRQELAAGVTSAFAAVLRARELAALAAFEREVATELAAFEQRRFDAGAGTLIDLNVTRAAEGRAARRVALALADEAAARASLAEVVALPVSDLPAAAGRLPDAWPAPAALAELERLALDQRSDLLALRAEVEAATARIRLERSLATPNLVIGLATGREADREDLDTVRAGFAVPLFQRNQGGIATARAEADVLSARLASAELAVRREVTAAWSRAEATSRALAVFLQTVAGTLEENLDLVQRGLAAGKLRGSEVLVFRRELIDSRRELIEAAADAWLAQIELELATGTTTVPPTSDPSSSAETTR
ncbi:MAG: TolC family protein [Thermoanaerobaculia bacterium]|nr:TolC family protein [Thermoanaerobaculia bacterium]